MSHLTKAILWLLLALLMIFCCVLDVINQNWFALVVCIIAFVFDIVDASVEFSAWAREQGKKDARKTEEDDDT
jgi:Flp pilus assembly protein protease CpaA